MSDIKTILLAIEPDFDKVVELGPDVVSTLIELVQLDEPLLSSRATYALGWLAAATESGKFPASAIDKISGGIQAAARSQLPLVRVAAAVATHGLPSHAAAPVQLRLLKQKEDIGVRRTVLEALRRDAEPAVVARIKKWSAEEPDKNVKDLALKVLERIAEGPRLRPVNDEGILRNDESV
jgi:HEAT repeat protein